MTSQTLSTIVKIAYVYTLSVCVSAVWLVMISINFHNYIVGLYQRCRMKRSSDNKFTFSGREFCVFPTAGAKRFDMSQRARAAV